MEPKLGAELRRLRLLKGVTLRDVATETGVSNAYISQLENEKADQPSPRVLHKLAEYYNVAYTQLMQLAGYLEATGTAAAGRGNLSSANAAMLGELTPDEAKALRAYLQVYRQQKASEED